MNDGNKKIKNRQSNRLKNYDYSTPGAYFVTVCVKDKEPLLSKIVGVGSKPTQNKDTKVILSKYGKIVDNTWNDLVNHISNIELDEYVIMPNHFHGIIIINKRAGYEPAPTSNGKAQPLPEIIRQFKTFSARRINKLRNATGKSVWQRNYYEHIIRNDDDLFETRKYIINNPKKWKTDKYYAK